MKDFTIIIPTYNNLELAEKAIQSAISQKDVTYQIVVTDDSTDNKIKDYCEVIKNDNLFYYHNAQPSGAVNNWNEGIKHIDSFYTIIMHHDERMKDTFYLKEIKKYFNLGYDVIVSNLEVFIGHKKKMRHFTSFMKKYFINHPILLFLSNAIGPCACLAIRSQLVCNFNKNLHWLVDVDWYYNNIVNRKVKYINNIYITSTFGHKNQITCNMNVPLTLKEDARIITQMHDNRFIIKLLLSINKMIQRIKFILTVRAKL